MTEGVPSQTCAFTVEYPADGAQPASVRAVLAGPWLVGTVSAVDADVRAAASDVRAIDASRVHEIDTVGAWVIARLMAESGAVLIGASDKAQRLIAAVQDARPQDEPPAPAKPLAARMVARVGENVIGAGAGVLAILSFLGALLSALGGTIAHPRRLRGRALIRQIELVGIDSLGIIALMSFLVGIVIAQQGAVQLQQFGAEIYTVNLTGRLAFRELGVLMTAIMVAGRSGSAFAAQIGTMKLTEEVDAMRTIGVSPTEALILPRVLAAVLMMPLLGFYSSIIAIVGGAVISAVTLDIPFWNFIARVQEVVPLRDLWVGVVKGPVFGLIIAMTGCYQGMMVSGNSEEVGHRTTNAVVQAIFVVIVLDAFFAVFFSEIGWI
ncbi:MlaE family lipid ABC transporter permease subunit [Novosphingobium sp. FSY-8]|uniref:MlaE family lipid ABC transporter permease subunit n=1 Tax=Novosphingobium ovatum TaxID=1908523 RepID=A0ABW9XE38_9SPHN|nr:ABC transporter permease [Novosphingobium ovatum]NBC36772.1 MlaE family lipid ABC transporter permease subunit [Novosphingobium ovatum]